MWPFDELLTVTLSSSLAPECPSCVSPPHFSSADRHAPEPPKILDPLTLTSPNSSLTSQTGAESETSMQIEKRPTAT